MALERAMEVFWARGYAGTSISELTEAMGINSPSLYAAFGSKEELFREAVALYVATDDSCTLKMLEGDLTTRDSIAAMLIAMPESFPMALGVIYESPAPTFDSAVREQEEAAAAGKKPDLQALVSKGQSWMVGKEPREI